VLHLRLNQMMPDSTDQLPVWDAGGDLFGPRTEAKVKDFQKAYEIDKGSPDFRDGVVGPHTREVLERSIDLVLKGFVLKYPTWIRPPFPPTPPIPKPTPAPPPRPIAPGQEAQKTKDAWGTLSVQAGAMSQFGYRQPDTGSVYFQATGNVLVCKNMMPVKTELALNFGAQHLFTVSERFPIGRPGSRGGADLQLFVGATLTRNDLFSVPGLRLGLGVQGQGQNLLPFLNDPVGWKPVGALGFGGQLGYKLPISPPGVKEISIGIGGMGLLFYSFSENHLRSRISTGSQWNGFVNIEFGKADDGKDR
jgi:hypothetical protein